MRAKQNVPGVGWRAVVQRLEISPRPFSQIKSPYYCPMLLHRCSTVPKLPNLGKRNIFHGDIERRARSPGNGRISLLRRKAVRKNAVLAKHFNPGRERKGRRRRKTNWKSDSPAMCTYYFTPVSFILEARKNACHSTT